MKCASLLLPTSKQHPSGGADTPGLWASQAIGPLGDLFLSHTHKGLLPFLSSAFIWRQQMAQWFCPAAPSSMDEGWTALTHICCKASKQYSFCPLLLGYTSKSSSNGATETYFHVSGFGLKMKSESVTLKHSSPPVHRWLTIPELSLKHLSWSFVQIYFQCVLCVGSPCNAVNGLQGNGTGIFISKGKVTFSFPGPKGSGLRSKGALGVGMVGGYPTHYICFSALWGSAQAREEENYLLWRWRNCCSNGKINPAGFKAFPSSFQALHSTVCPWKLNSMGLNSTSWMTLGKSLNLSRPWWS